MHFADLAEVDAFLAAHPAIHNFELFIIDPCGVPRGKLLRREELRAVYQHGRPLLCAARSCAPSTSTAGRCRAASSA